MQTSPACPAASLCPVSLCSLYLPLLYALSSTSSLSFPLMKNPSKTSSGQFQHTQIAV